MSEMQVRLTQYDASGRSTGKAFVWFVNEADAHAAVSEYDGAMAKGKPIHLRVLETRYLRSSKPSRSGNSLAERLGATPSLNSNAIKEARIAGIAERRGGHRTKRSGRRRGNARPTLSAADLDAELDAFMKTPAVRNTLCILIQENYMAQD